MNRSASKLGYKLSRGDKRVELRGEGLNNVEILHGYVISTNHSIDK